MGYEVDTASISAVANKIRNIANTVKDLSTTDIRRIKNQVDGNFEGEAAKALDEVLNDLNSDIRSISSGLDGIRRDLIAYIAHLEELERQATEIVNKL